MSALQKVKKVEENAYLQYGVSLKGVLVLAIFGAPGTACIFGIINSLQQEIWF